MNNQPSYYQRKNTTQSYNNEGRASTPINKITDNKITITSPINKNSNKIEKSQPNKIEQLKTINTSNNQQQLKDNMMKFSPANQKQKDKHHY